MSAPRGCLLQGVSALGGLCSLVTILALLPMLCVCDKHDRSSSVVTLIPNKIYFMESKYFVRTHKKSKETSVTGGSIPIHINSFIIQKNHQHYV